MIDVNSLSKAAYNSLPALNIVNDCTDKNKLSFTEIKSISELLIEKIFHYTSYLKEQNKENVVNRYKNIQYLLIFILAFSYINNINLNEIIKINNK